MTWGDQPTSQQTEQRTSPIVTGKDNRPYFVPMDGKQHVIQIITAGEWLQPMEIWTHDLYNANGGYDGNIFCKKMHKDDHCPYCELNDRAENKAGMKLQNADRPAPIKKKYIFPVIVDECPEHPFAWYKVHEQLLKQIVAAVSAAIANGGQMPKLVIGRAGAGKQSSYTAASTGIPVDMQRMNQLQLPPQNKKYFIDACSYTQQQPTQQYQQQPAQPTQLAQQYQQYQQQPTQQQPTQQQPTQQQYQQQPTPQQPTTNDNGIQQALEYQMNVGIHAGKKLKDLPRDVLEMIARNMYGDVQKHAATILNSGVI
jgi:hypothetical protein